MSTTVFHNGPIFLADAAGSTASAVAVVDGRIVAVGGDREVADFLGTADAVVDLRGRMLVPGFTDAHAHPVQGGIERNRCDLTLRGDLDGYRELISQYVARHPGDEWVLGGGWAMSAFPGGVPEARMLDELVGSRPAFLPNRDHHSAWVNTEALRRAGIDANTPDPADGRIERDADGRPTGALHEGAMALVERVVPADTQDDFDEGLRSALTHLNSVGVVGWQDALVSSDTSRPNAHAAYLRADKEGWLTARVSGALWWERGTTADRIDDEVERLAWLRDATNDLGSDRYGIHSVKVMQDGVAETYTAAMLAPYLDRCGCHTDNSGISFLAPDVLRQVITRLDAAGFQAHVHALGDKAVRDTLDAFEEVRRRNGSSGLRHHMAHLQFVDAPDIPRFRELDVAVNIQPLWAAHEAQVDELTVPFVGPERSARMYPFGELERAGSTLVMGSDWPITAADPMLAIHVAVNRMTPDRPEGTPPLGVGQELTLKAALRAYTAGSAYINRREHLVGTIRPGAAADLVVLERDPFSVPAEEIGSIRVDATYVNGDEVFQRTS